MGFGAGGDEGGGGGGDEVRGQESRISMLTISRISSSSGKVREISSMKEKGIRFPTLPLRSAKLRLLRGALGGLVRLYGVSVMLETYVAFSASSWLYSAALHASRLSLALFSDWSKGKTIDISDMERKRLFYYILFYCILFYSIQHHPAQAT